MRSRARCRPASPIAAGRRITVGVLALQGATEAHVRALTGIGAHPVEVRSAAQLAGVEALVIPGGESTTISLLLDASGLRQPLLDWLSTDRPVLGTCAGMILLASEVLDGRPDQKPLGVVDIAVRRNAFGRQVDSFESDLVVAGVAGGPFPAVFIRAPLVERAGPQVEVLASIDGRPVLCRQGRVMVSSFHPELSDDTRLHQLFLKER